MHRSFEETVKKSLQETQERLDSKLNIALQALDTKKPPHVKEETWTPVKLQMAWSRSKTADTKATFIRREITMGALHRTV